MTALETLDDWSEKITTHESKHEIYKSMIKSKYYINLFAIAEFDNVFNDILSNDELVKLLRDCIFHKYPMDSMTFDIIPMMIKSNAIKTPLTDDEIKILNWNPNKVSEILVQLILADLVDITKVKIDSNSVLSIVRDVYNLAPKESTKTQNELTKILDVIFNLIPTNPFFDWQWIGWFETLKRENKLNEFYTKYVLFTIKDKRLTLLNEKIFKIACEKNVLVALVTTPELATNEYFHTELNKFICSKMNYVIDKHDVSGIFQYLKPNKKVIESLLSAFKFYNVRTNIIQTIDINEIAFVLALQNDIVKYGFTVTGDDNKKVIVRTLKFMTPYQLGLININTVIAFDLLEQKDIPVEQRNLPNDFVINQIKLMLTSNVKVKNYTSCYHYVVKKMSESIEILNAFVSDESNEECYNLLTENRKLEEIIMFISHCNTNVSNEKILQMLSKFKVCELAKQISSFGTLINKNTMEKLCEIIPELLDIFIEEKIKKTKKYCDDKVNHLSKKRKINDLYAQYDADKEKTQCKICLENVINQVFVQCGHTICSDCVTKTVACPFCRIKSETIGLFLS